MRSKLTGDLTPVTKESFAIWKAKKKEEKEEKRKVKVGKRERDIASGKVAMTGRELYESKKDIFVDDNNADETVYDLHENLSQAIEEQLKLIEDASGEDWDQDRIQKERLKIEEELKKAHISSPQEEKPKEEETLDIEDESLFMEEDIPDE